jgi:2-polyprenyl-3-methyl-5-hydroxy-6-metoxy-1,4-benzoquinol methylase
MTGTTPLEYARWRETALGAVTERLERAAVLDLAGPLAGRDVLDVGCGDGTYALAAARAGARVTAADRSAAVVEAARCNSADAGLEAAGAGRSASGRRARLGAAFIAIAGSRPAP